MIKELTKEAELLHEIDMSTDRHEAMQLIRQLEQLRMSAANKKLYP